MFVNWLTTVWALPAVQMAAWAVMAGMVGALWGVSEIVGAFKIETGRALRTGGAWLLILFNFVASGLIYLLAAATLVGANGWLTAILVGLAWPTVFRNLSFKLAQPLDSNNVNETAAVRIEQAYRSVQALAQQLIDASITRQRMKLVDRALKLPLADLEKKARLAVIVSPVPSGQEGLPDDYVNKIMARAQDDEIKKALLATFILTRFSRETLEEMLSDLRRRP